MENRRTAQVLAAELRQKAENIGPGAAKDHLLREARRIEEMSSASHRTESEELPPPV